MMKLIYLIILFFNSLVFGFNSNIKAIYAIGIFDKNGKGENIQHLLKTQNNYNNTCFTKIFIIGKSFNKIPQVSIGTSKGHYQKRVSIYNSKKIKIGEELLFKHYKVTKGYIQIKLEGKIYDTKVFVK